MLEIFISGLIEFMHLVIYIQHWLQDCKQPVAFFLCTVTMHNLLEICLQTNCVAANHLRENDLELG